MIEIECKNCSKKVITRYENTIFCGRKCYSEHKIKTGSSKTGKIIKCENCNKEKYKPLAQLDGRKNFCSKKCANEYQGRKKIITTCIVCKKQRISSPSQKYKYCSVKCRDKDPKVKEMLNKMNAEQSKNKKETNIEIIGYEILNNLKLNFEKQYLVNKKFCVDAFLPKEKIIIQFDGDYWHGYNQDIEKANPRVKKRMQLDISQDAYFKKLGYKVLRFWEHELKLTDKTKIYDIIRNSI
jgi:DNA mismatch endonuclease (patch repair protein)